MKFFAILAAVVAVSAASPSSWSLKEVSEAISNPTTDPMFKPVLYQALDVLMNNIHAGFNMGGINIQTAAGVGGTFDLQELDAALAHASPVSKPYLEAALNHMMESLFAGHDIGTVQVQMPALELSYWSLNELDVALTSPNTNKALVPYLEHALNELMAAIFSGQSEASIVVAVPVDIASVDANPAVAPIVGPAPVAAPAPAAASAPASNPLVQIVLNVQKSKDLGEVENSQSSPVDRPTPASSVFNPIDNLAPLPIEALLPAPAAAVGPLV